MNQYRGIDYLREKLEIKRTRVRLRYKYYEMKDFELPPGITVPTQLRMQFKSTCGWCAKAVDGLADRLQFRGFENDNFQMMDIYNMNNPDILFDSAILGALISSCDFIYISKGEEDQPRLQVIDGSNATGEIDHFTGLLREGYAVLERDELGAPTVEAYFVPGMTQYFRKGSKTPEEYPNKVAYPLLVPIIYRPDAARPFGHSRITRTCMYLQKYAKNTLERSEVSAEFYSFPQKYVLGLNPDAEKFDTWKATIASMLDFRQDEETGTIPQVGQFTQQSMTPYMDQLRTAASMFAGETGLTLDDLGFVQQNPSSAEAIKASHESLRLIARKAQRCFGSGFLNAGYLAACLRDNKAYERSEVYKTKAQWEPIFEPDMAALGLIGDGVNKINQAVPGYFTEQNLRDLTGIESAKEDEEYI